MIEILKEIVERNKQKLAEVNGDQFEAKGLIIFEYEGHEIYNPFKDETLMIDVNPYKHYGLKRIITMLVKHVCDLKNWPMHDDTVENEVQKILITIKDDFGFDTFDEVDVIIENGLLVQAFEHWEDYF